jgi:acyl dehydratase
MAEVDQSLEAATSYTILEEDLELDRKALGLDYADVSNEFFSIATEENIRNFAYSYGDDNPLYCDPHYGASTRWGGQIAPGVMSGILNRKLFGERPPRELRGGRYRGIHVFASRFHWEFYQPPRPGDVFYAFVRLDDVKESHSGFAGRAIFRTTRWVKMNQRAEILGVHRMVGIYAERKRAGENRKKSPPVEPAVYDDAALAEIDAVYAQERRRGAEPRWWEDVQPGDSIDRLAKGPFTLTDIIAFHAGGYHLTDLRTSRRAWQNRTRIPAFYVKNAQGIPDVAQRVHWDTAFSQATGNALSIDYGSMREFWLHHGVTDWMGDDGWIVDQHVELKKFSLHGDSHLITGTVTRKEREGERCIVRIEAQATNQRGIVTAEGSFTVALPSRAHGPVPLVAPSEELREQARRMMEHHERLSREARDADR